MESVADVFGSLVFDDRVMKATLSQGAYQSLKKTIDEGAPLDPAVANQVADAMKEWAIGKGATHFTHWFQPLTGITAEKHDGFICPSTDGRVLMEFGGKELIKGEPDASSFPSGGIRATFEARGYTAWDPTSYAFIKGKTLCIPTAFCSYGGEALDKKTPLLRSMAALNRQALRVLKLFGDRDVKCVRPMVGPEQEYFLVDKAMFEKREDLVCCGRTLFGARPPKGQERSDHYFGAIKPRVAAYMAELNEELWKVGVLAKTEHNEVAPAQHELAPIYSVANVAADHNQLTMEIMQKVAIKHGLMCLLHEKPFAGVNGSGKHNNWSLSTDTGVNLLSPGETPYQNARFLLFLCAVIQAVDDYQDLLRLSVATASSDLRLGANEAPPAVLSIFLGDELSAILKAIEKDEPYHGGPKKILKLGVDTLPDFARDNTDRNRTSPFAFTGNKFEFRMVGSSDSISCANIMLNTAVAESLRQYADRLEGVSDFEGALHTLIQEVIKGHKRILFDGNGYDEGWLKEAERRGLCNYPTTPDCMPHLTDPKNVELLMRHEVYNKVELQSRCEIMLDNYCKTVAIEANTMLDMAHKQILPAVSEYVGKLCATGLAKKSFGPAVPARYEKEAVAILSSAEDKMVEASEALSKALVNAQIAPDVHAESRLIRDEVLPLMNELREAADLAECWVDGKEWPFPFYCDLLFGVR